MNYFEVPQRETQQLEASQSPLNLETPLSKFKYWAQSQGDKNYLYQPFGRKFRTTSWQEAYDQIAKMANYLSRFPKGSRIGIYSNNCDHWILADLAIFAAGMISVPIYPTGGIKTIRQIVEHAEIQLVFVGKLLTEEGLAAFDDNLDKVAIYQQRETMQWWYDIIDAEEPLEPLFAPVLSDIASIVYTSGTTGNPKGVMISYRTISEGFNCFDKTFAFSPDERFFSYLPLAHVAERMAVEMASIFYGCSINFVESLEQFATNLRRTQPSFFFGVPRIWIKLKQQIESRLGGAKKFQRLISLPIIGNWLKRFVVSRLGFSQVKFCLSGGASISKDVIQWYETLGIVINEAYGMSESLGFSNANRPGAIKIGSVGKTLVNCEVSLATNGEILLRSPCVMDGYYKEPELTAATIQEGWLRTGDLGEIDEQGFLTIKGRIKEIFKTSKGKYIAPVPIEEKLETELGVDQVCVMGAGLQQPVAVMVLDSVIAESDINTTLKEIERKLTSLNQQLEKHEKIAILGISYTGWTPQNGLMTPTLKLRRQQLEDYYLDSLQGLTESNNKCAVLSL